MKQMKKYLAGIVILFLCLFLGYGTTKKDDVATTSSTVTESKEYTTKEEVALYIHEFGHLPEKKGRTYQECDINADGGYRGALRIIFSNDGLVYYTEDHYETFELLYGEE